ncbi:anti-sigma factor domain-containing protein [Sphingomonas sp. DT-51]|uniref:anti-sigma factor n=1 Tax=Sphingomonas sp. DT-51 TaxID=3396165 RepID=UPI003F19B72D
MTPDDRALAAELALGVLDGAELTAARARLASDRDFAGEVARWDAWLAPLAHHYADVAPRAELERRVLDAIEPHHRTQSPQWRHWGALALAGMAAAILALVLAPTRVPPPTALPPRAAPAIAPPLLAALAVPAGAEAPGRGALAAAVDPVRAVISVSAVAVPPSRSAQLWAIPAGGAAPVPLGLLAAGSASRVTAPARARPLLVPGTTLAVSIEPGGGSPTGAPTGPVVAAGALAAG